MAWTDYSSAPPQGTVVCAQADVDPFVSLSVESENGSLPIIVVRTQQGLVAYVNACPHQYLPLDYQQAQIVSADGTKLMCSAHGAMFDASTGDVKMGAPCGLDRVPITIRDGQVLIGAET